MTCGTVAIVTVPSPHFASGRPTCCWICLHSWYTPVSQTLLWSRRSQCKRWESRCESEVWEWGWSEVWEWGWGVGVRMRWGVGVRMRWGVGVRVNCLKLGIGSMCAGECCSIGVVLRDTWTTISMFIHFRLHDSCVCFCVVSWYHYYDLSLAECYHNSCRVSALFDCLATSVHSTCVTLYCVICCVSTPWPNTPLWCDGCGDELMMVQYVLLLAVSFKCPIFCFRYVTSSIWSWAKRKPYECCRTSLMTVSMLYLLCFWREPTRWLR